LVNYIDTRLRRGRRAATPEDDADMLATTFGQEIT
jgi:polar amino acid transport system substrate-binding protein